MTWTDNQDSIFINHKFSVLGAREWEKILNSARLTTMIVAFVFLAGLSFSHRCFAANYTYSYWLLDHPDGSQRYELTVSVTSSLFEYYDSKDHNLYSSIDFGKFVTPYALKPMADSLWSIYSNEEDFANGVLMIMHQIPYVVSAPQKYPVETIVQNEGDCDLLSFISASVMMAGGLDVVLFYYEAEMHMNVGVYLSHAPNDARSEVYYIDHSGKSYYVAETTGGFWEEGWRVGECPDELKEASAQIITLEDAEQLSPGQVSSGYNALASSSLSLTLSSTYITQGAMVTVSGQLSPVGSDKTVTIYGRRSGSQWSILGTTLTDSDGRFSFLWKPETASTYFLRASWSGDSDYAGADSSIHSLTILPIDWNTILIVSIISASLILVVVIIAVSRRKASVEEIFPGDETESIYLSELVKRLSSSINFDIGVTSSLRSFLKLE
ncbi:MAG: Ig-like domain-containing protein [Candidatus Bathyarchaeota archaeon]